MTTTQEPKRMLTQMEQNLIDREKLKTNPVVQCEQLRKSYERGAKMAPENLLKYKAEAVNRFWKRVTNFLNENYKDNDKVNGLFFSEMIAIYREKFKNLPLSLTHIIEMENAFKDENEKIMGVLSDWELNDREKMEQIKVFTASLKAKEASIDYEDFSFIDEIKIDEPIENPLETVLELYRSGLVERPETLLFQPDPLDLGEVKEPTDG